MTIEIDDDARTGIDATLMAAAKAARWEFLLRMEPYRPRLYAFCRRLTANPFDAEDLVQDVLTKAYVRAAQSHTPVDDPLPWLLRVAGNAFIDQQRRRPPEPVDPASLAEQPAEGEADPGEVRAAIAEVVTRLPPQERAAVVLKDVFDYPAREIAEILGTTEGAVRSALHRGRSRLVDPLPSTRPAPDRALVTAVAAAFTSYDIERLVGLFMERAESHIVGMLTEDSRDQIARGSILHTLDTERDRRYRGDVVDIGGDPMVVLFARPTDGSAPEAMSDLLRLETTDQGIRRIEWYFFCPEVLAEVAASLGVPVRTNGYHY